MVKKFWGDPLNKAAIVVWMATLLSSVGTELIHGNTPWITVITGLVSGLVLLFLPNDTVLAQDLETLLPAMIEAAVKRNPESIGRALEDAGKLVSDLNNRSLDRADR